MMPKSPQKFLVWVLALLALPCPGLAQLPNPGTHTFESDFLGASSEIYGDDSHRPVVEGWTGFRNPYGDHQGTLGYSIVSGGIVSYRGGHQNFSDSMVLLQSGLTGLPGSYRIQVKFRRNADHSNARADFVLDVGSIRYYVDSGSEHATGSGIRSGATRGFASSPISSGTWYVLEVIDVVTSPTCLQLWGGNFETPEASVDWIFLDPQPSATGLEMRLWVDGTPRPGTPLVSAPAVTGTGACLAPFVGDPSSTPVDALSPWGALALVVLLAGVTVFRARAVRSTV